MTDCPNIVKVGIYKSCGINLKSITNVCRNPEVWKRCPFNKKDKLDIIFNLQWQLQTKLGAGDLLFTNKEARQKYITISAIALIDEVMEALRETPWKPWKIKQKMNLTKFKEELVDALHFFINLCLAADMNADELFKQYCMKNKINVKRTEDGY